MLWYYFSSFNAFGMNDSLARTALATAISLLCVLFAGRLAIPRLSRLRIAPGESASRTLNELHQHKRFTPTMGGSFVLFGFAVALVACADLRQANIQVALGLGLGLALLGAADDLLKLSGSRRGLSARQKLAGQMLLALCAAGWLRTTTGVLPAFDGWHFAGFDLALVATVCWIAGASNGVNVTDGLDGLATGCLLWATAAVGLLIYHDLASASPWPFPAEPEKVNCLVLAGTLFGSLLGFLKFNRRPARVFLGDTGSLPLGGLLGLLTLASGNQLACLVVGAVFVIELASVALQVAWFKSSGKRLFRCAPLHHHFQFKGWSEGQVVRRFCAVAALCAALGVVLGWTDQGTRNSGVAAASGESPAPAAQR